MNVVLFWVCVACGAAATARWLRVAQREHYGAGRVSRFARRWWLLGWENRSAAVLAALGLVVSGGVWWAPAITAAAVLGFPAGLGLRGSTSPLRWTRRAVTLAAAAAMLAAVVLAAGALAGASAIALAAVLCALPVLVDLALLLVAPLESALSRRWVRSARKRLDRIDPLRIAITGSYGKTTIKGYVAHLLSGAHEVVASPKSYNNTAGLCRTVRERLSRSTEVFVAEMGAYGPGEIAAMCKWVRPQISLLAAIGPVHMERFGSLDRIVAAKTEIFATSRTAIVNIDAYGLEAEANRLAASGITVIRCSQHDPSADVSVICMAADEADEAADETARRDRETGAAPGTDDDTPGTDEETSLAASGTAANPDASGADPASEAEPNGQSADRAACERSEQEQETAGDASVGEPTEGFPDPSIPSAAPAALDASGTAADAAWSDQAVVRIFGTTATVSLGQASAVNVACALAVAAAAGMSVEQLLARLDGLPTVEHRRSAGVGPSGIGVIDDTYNSNPAGAQAALLLLKQTPASRRAVVTPGMVELGRSQAAYNEAFARQAAEIADDVLIVGRTNRTALLAGAAGWTQAQARRNRSRSVIEPASPGRATVRLMASRSDAVAWVRSHLSDGDMVLYENDLPDHYP